MYPRTLRPAQSAPEDVRTGSGGMGSVGAGRWHWVSAGPTRWMKEATVAIVVEVSVVYVGYEAVHYGALRGSR